ncbi:helicase domino isoform X2 [Cimex lectularius]|uniref:Helicase domino n=1 Tax=Cimex lectularius TaxID=79782 RepID=A0A8I6STC2_CIMLE|nr:helicase domino isoform X2 [Cimex lectularius]
MSETHSGLVKPLLQKPPTVGAQLLPLVPAPTTQQGAPAMTRLGTVNQGGWIPVRSASNNGGGDSSMMSALLNQANSHPNLTNTLTSPNSRKRKTTTDDLVALRRKVAENHSLQLKRLQSRYAENSALLCFLQGNFSINEYAIWRQRLPPGQLINFLKLNKLNPSDENEDLFEILQSQIKSSNQLSHSPPKANQLDQKFILPDKSSSSTAISKTSTPTKSTSHGSLPENSISSQEQIVERAKQEAYVMQRIGELQKDGLWAEKRLPKVHELSRTKAHWDYLIEEMTWLAADFAQERKWKKAAAKKCAKMVQKYFQEKEVLAQKAVKAQEMQLKRIASFIAKEIKTFWGNVEKLVEFKTQTRLEEKRKKALDQHLSFIVDQTEKYSSLVAESMNTSRPTSPKHHSDMEFEPEGSSDDDEETIAKEEALSAIDKESAIEEIDALKRESELPLEDLLSDYLSKRDSLGSPTSSKYDDEEDDEDEKDIKSLSDNDFRASDKDSSDDEETIQEEEKLEGKVNYKQEIDELKAEGDMSLEELKAKYGVQEDKMNSSQDEKMDLDEDSDDMDEDENESEEVDIEDDEDIEEDLSGDSELEEESGLKSLLNDGVNIDKSSTDKDKEINDVAAIAESLQPKGNTLSSTSVVTRIPFLLKHPLREYQHIGLDWLVTMYERKLNGILADEMGLGKTIQTIALIAHLACEKGNWGPHLIVVPTSVMLNWEMEFKKWCPAFKILTYYGSQKERKLKRSGWTKTNAFHICITSYKLVIQDHQSFRRKKWKYLILDEAQNIKNFKSQRWQLLLNFQTQRRLLLTGTPLQNNLMELWSLMHFLMPNVFESHREFKEWFSNPVTGMIEGNAEYNENIIKRLHKVLRPFLLRRLKSEVETQMPKKYEHIVMCRLSNRQRYLYDDFMSRAKTKETLASGNLLSVINVLMQLRKVCNHPNLFEVRPTISPFQMEGLNVPIPSLVWGALDYRPTKDVDLSALNLRLIDYELWLLAFIAHRSRKFKTRSELIQGIDEAPPDPPPCPKGRVKIQIKRKPYPPPTIVAAATAQTQNKTTFVQVASTGNNHRYIASLPATKVGTSPIIKSIVGSGNQGVTLRFANPTSQQPQYVQLLQQPGGGVKAISVASLTSTGQVVKTTDGTTGTMARIVPQFTCINTAGGRQLLLSSPQVIPSQAGGTTVMTASGQRLTVLSKQGTNIAKLVSPTVTQINSARPIMRVPPLNITTATTTTVQNCITIASNNVTATSTVDATVSAVQTSTLNSITPTTVKNMTTRNSSKTKEIDEPPSLGLKDDILTERRRRRRQEKLTLISRVNEMRCNALPIYGVDLIESLSLQDKLTKETNWLCTGYIHCKQAKSPDPSLYWNKTEALQNMIYSIEERVANLSDIFNRFVMFVPAASAPRPSAHVSHPAPWKLHREQQMEIALEEHLKPKLRLLHPIASAMSTLFPDPRLIQYDCGKLQSLDHLLRKLKSEHHRVLIFTQMTRMLDVLEAFLNFHGHIYLRLDGTTKVDQRQVLMERFNADKRIFCFILSTRSGGVGINLTGADTVIFYDSDWNPTMDAQAQDRCHRIGQTRDVHIYRLVSEKTVEENILKKANQKRMLGDLAIEGGNFTTAYFKSSTIQDLFNVDTTENDASRRMADVLQKESEKKLTALEPASVTNPEDKTALGALESALAQAEDDTDVAAASVAKAEAADELAEFDETIPLEQPEGPELSKAEMELNLLMQQLSGVERYAMKFMEETEAVWSAEQLAAVEAEIEQQKREWEQGRLAAFNEEESQKKRQAEAEMEDIITYSSTDARNQLWISDDGKDLMPMWCPPTPPQDDSDVYIDQALGLLYEQKVMTEEQLPPVFVKKEKKRTRIEAGLPEGGRVQVKMRQREETLLHAPRSLFDRPTPALIKMRQELRLQKCRGLIRPSIQNLMKPQLPVKPLPEPDHVPEWVIQEDWTILQAIQNIQELTLNLVVLSPGQTPNWDLVADIVNLTARTYRSPKQCRNRYESVVIPREEGKLVLDSPKKQKKTKTLYKIPQIKAGRPLRTSQLYQQDNNTSMTQVMNTRFDAIRAVSNKRAPTIKPLLVDPTMKNPKHAEILAENAIDYEKPMTPIEVAAKRADRIAKEKQAFVKQGMAVPEQQLAVLRLKQQLQSSSPKTTVATTTVTTTTITAQTTTSPPTRTIAVQELTTTGRVVASSPTQSTIVAQRSPSTNIISAQSSPTVTTVKGSTKTISAAQLQIYRQQQLQFRQQNLRVLQSRGGGTAGQKISVAVPTGTTTQRMPQVKAAGVTRTVSESEVVALFKRQQAAKVSTATTLTSAQILAQASLQAQQSGSTGVGQVTTLVKTIPASSIPVGGLTQMKALGTNIKQGTVTPQQIKSIQQQLMAQRKLAQQKVTQIGQVTSKAGTTAQLIVQSQKTVPTTMTMQQFQQAIKQVQPQHVQVAQGSSPQVISHSVFTKTQGGSPARVIPVATSSQQPIKHAIQVVSGNSSSPGRSVTIDASGRTTQTALAGALKTGSASQQAILTQVSAAVIQPGHQITMRQPVRIQAATAPLVAVAVSQAPTVLTLPPQDNNQS